MGDKPVRNTIKLGAAAVLGLSLAQPALADQAETKGGLTVKTDDGRFEFKLGGRFHIDGYVFDGCEAGGTDCPSGTTLGGMFLRRGYITASGKLYGWKFKSEFDPAASASAQSTWREAWVSTEALGGEIIIGQFKPFRSMEELTSSNEILMMERPYSSASSLYGGGSRQFQVGVGYKMPFSMGLWAIGAHNLHAIGAAANEGLGASTRLTFLPIASERSNLHFGLVYGIDNANRTGPGVYPTGFGTVGPGAATLAGRTGTNQVTSPTVAMGTAAAGESQDTWSVEAAGAFGPAFFQAEYAASTLNGGDVQADMDVTSYYVQGSYFVTGETKPYKKDRGTFGTPKPLGENGAWEITARYDTIENSDLATEPEVTQTTVGLNWYLNPNVRLMLNYSMGEAETVAGDAELNAIALRTQLSF
jgi:phosphate-selective porin OprO/OprP